MHRVLSLEQVWSFVVVAEELHFGRAAARLSVTQPPLSRRIQQLEKELGVQLFDRAHHNVALTPAGQVFLTDARRILRLSEEATINARRVPQGEIGTISVGFTAASAYTYLGELMEVAATRLPEVEIVLREMVSDDQFAALYEHTIDLGLVRPPVRSADVRSIRVSREPMLAAVPLTPRFASFLDADLLDAEGGLPLRLLHEQPFIMYWPSGSRYFHDLLLAAFQTVGIQPNFRQFVTQIHTMLALVRAGVGLALVPAAGQALNFDGVRLVPVTGLPRFNAELHLAWRPEGRNPARDALIAALRKD